MQLTKTDVQLLDDSGMASTGDQSKLTCGRSLMADRAPENVILG